MRMSKPSENSDPGSSRPPAPTAGDPASEILKSSRTIAVVGDVYRFLATGDDTNGKYALWEALVPPGGGPPPGPQGSGGARSRWRRRKGRSP